MANMFAGGIHAGATSRSIVVLLRSAVDATEMTGKVAADLTASYLRQGGIRVAITLSNLAAVDSAYSSGGVKEVDATNQKGLYRLDLPDAALATGVDWVTVSIFAAGSFVYHREYPLDVNSATTNAKAIQLVFTNAGKVDAAVLAAADFAQAAADKVWATAVRSLTTFGTLVADVWVAAGRTLTSFGFTVNLATSVWDEVAASHLTAGSTGEKLNAAASAGDPWVTALPGAYAAGTAGHRVGTNLDAAVSSVSVGTIPTASQVAAAVRAIVVETEGNVTLHEALSVILAAVAGVTDDEGRTRKTPAGAATRAVGTFNADGERTAVTLTPSA